MRLLLLFILLWSIATSLVGQEAYSFNHLSDSAIHKQIDSLKGKEDSSKKIALLNELLNRHLAENEFDTTAAKIKNSMGYEYQLYGSLDKALEQYESVYNKLSKTPFDKHPTYVTAIAGIGSYYRTQREINKAETYFLKALKLQEKIAINNFAHLSAANNLASISIMKGAIDRAEKYFLKSIHIAEKVLGKDNENYYTLLNNLAILYLKTDQLDEAEVLLLKVRKYWVRKNVKNNSYAKNVATLGGLYRMKRQKELALNFKKEAVQVNLDLYGPSSRQYMRALNGLAVVLRNQGKVEESIDYYKKALEISQKVYPPNHLNTLVFQANLAVAYADIKAHDQAIKLFKKTIDAYEKKGTEALRNIDYIICIKTYGNILMDLGQYEQAEKKFLKYKDRINQIAKKQEHNGVVMINNELAILYTYTEEYKQAFELLKTALCANSFDLDTIPAFSLAFINSLDKVKFNSPRRAMLTLGVMSSVLEKIDDPKANEKIYAICVLFKNLMNQWQGDFVIGKDALELLSSENNMRFILEGIKRATAAYQKNKNIAIANDALGFIETNKSLLLKKTLRTQDAHKITSVPDSLRQKEKQIKKGILKLKKQLVENTDKQKEGELISKLNDYYTKADEFKRTIKQKHQDYYKIKYENQSIDIAQVQASLKDQQTILEYYVTDSATFLLLISPSAIRLLELDVRLEELQESIRELRQSISNYSFINKYSKKSYELFSQQAHQLYNWLILPVEPSLEKGAPLIIIPDNVLGNIPFEVLLTKPSNQDYKYAELDYLLKAHPISYSYSTSFIVTNHQKTNQSSNGKILGFAAAYNTIDTLNSSLRSPYTNKLRQQLEPIPAVEEEVKYLQANYKGDYYLGQAASENKFYETATDYSVIHLAMHGVLNETNPVLSSLAFTDASDSINDNFLQSDEIATQSLSAELVVLSACETGYGRFEQGEGVLSLARSFMHAGVPAMIVSLWQVNDNSTAKLMQFFYQNLASGMDKAKALQEAKIRYLNTTEGIALHPAFWSPFIQLGNTDAIQIAKKVNYTPWVLGTAGIGLLALGVWFGRRRRNKDK